ncbi:hypothetical protein COCC4DRAFT_23775 [Bipolaris maydis ATCC 48331]|uniref:Uncharacterized protein n=2 Tax=Cochliobolus heterostrophus TaxID=5016 RepID=M2U3D1_COCH5|nr:uncharacterized protein COCC4DRAFT_23775 [Bipolaris maydis ATCC 48331]EMD93069.1 hypothetical protein COCHEDRAFT_1029295 [Bipolaris maydis C5]ENI04542.1 hypothetical protein COCC4DRAFT_23775 [Bipolaris maydis ATCC 48331]KAJ6208096.1 hypothetical protein PSV09DRAFT_1029295 [Bipolaris maydis]
MSLPDGRLRTNGLGLHDAGHGIWAACQTRQWAPGPDGRLRKYQPVADSSAPAPTHTAMAHPTTTWLPSCPAAAGPVAAKSCQSALRALRMREQDDRVGTWCRQSGWLCGRAPPCACIAHPLQSWTRTCVLGTWTTCAPACYPGFWSSPTCPAVALPPLTSLVESSNTRLGHGNPCFTMHASFYPCPASPPLQSPSSLCCVVFTTVVTSLSAMPAIDRSFHTIVIAVVVSAKCLLLGRRCPSPTSGPTRLPPTVCLNRRP